MSDGNKLTIPDYHKIPPTGAKKPTKLELEIPDYHKVPPKRLQVKVERPDPSETLSRFRPPPGQSFIQPEDVPGVEAYENAKLLESAGMDTEALQEFGRYQQLQQQGVNELAEKTRKKYLIEQVFGKSVDEAINQFAYGAVNAYTLNLPDLVFKSLPETMYASMGVDKNWFYEAPESSLGKVARGGGELVGMLKGPFKWIGKGLGKLPMFAKAPKHLVGKMAQRVARESLTLALVASAGTQEGLERGKVLENIKARLNAFKDGAIMGGAFAGSSFINLPGKPVLSYIMRLGAMTGAVDILQGHNPVTEAIATAKGERDLVEKTYHYGLQLFFARHGKNPKELARLMKGVEKEVRRFNEEVRKLDEVAPEFNLPDPKKLASEFEAIKKEGKKFEKGIAEKGVEKKLDTESDIEYLDPTTGAMEHAGSATSVEALNRQKAISFYRYNTQTKELTPIVGTDAVDVPVGKNEVKIQVHKPTESITTLDVGENAKRVGPDELRTAYENKVNGKQGEPKPEPRPQIEAEIAKALEEGKPLTKQQNAYLKARTETIEEGSAIKKTETLEDIAEEFRDEEYTEKTKKTQEQGEKVFRVHIKAPNGRYYEVIGGVTPDKLEALRKYAKTKGLEDSVIVHEKEILKDINPNEQLKLAKKLILDAKTGKLEADWGDKAIDMASAKSLKTAGQEGFIKIWGERSKAEGDLEGKPTGFIGKLKSTLGRKYQETVDQFAPINKYVKLGEKLTGKKIEGFKNAYIQARVSMGWAGKAEARLLKSRFRVDKKGDVVWTGESLDKIVKDVDKAPDLDYDTFRKYLIARRVDEVTDWRPEYESPISKEEAHEFKEQYKSKYEPYAKRYTAFLHDLLHELYEVGYYDKPTLDLLMRRGKNYAPLNRLLEGLIQSKGEYVPTRKELFSRPKSPIKGLKEGAELPFADPIESAIKATYSITHAIQRNLVARSIVALRDLHPVLAELIKPTRPDMEHTGKKIKKATFADEAIEFESGEGYRPKAKQGEGIITVYKNGRRKYYEVPKDLYDAMAGMDQARTSMAVKLLSYPAKWVRAGATLTPDFGPKNLFRDQLSAYINSKVGYIPGFDFVRGAFHMIGKSDAYWRWKASGGDQACLVQMDRAMQRKTHKELLGHKNLKKWLNPLHDLQALSMATEQPTRVGVFKKHSKKISDVESAYWSREGSADFQGIGSKTRNLALVYEFANARLQGGVRLAKTAKEHPWRTALRMSPVLIATIVNYLQNRDDPEYWEIPGWQRDLFWCVRNPFGKGPKFFRIPKGDIGVLTCTPLEKICQFIDDEEKEVPTKEQSLTKLAGSIVQEMAPISNPKMGWLPTAGRIPVEIITNYKSFTDRPIETEGESSREPAYRYGRFTSETSKALGKALNMSPKKIDHVVTSLFAGLGRYGLQVSDEVLGDLGVIDKKAKTPKEWADYPVIRGFAPRDPIGFNSESVAQFYKKIDDIEKVSRTQKFLKDEKMRADLEKYAKENPTEYAIANTVVGKSSNGRPVTLATIWRRGRNSLTTLRKIMSRSMASKHISKEQKKKIQDEINAKALSIAVECLNIYQGVKDQIEEKEKNGKN